MWAVLAMVGAFTAVAVGYAHFTGEERVRRTLRRAPPTAISAMREDVRGKIVGRVHAVDELLEAPITGRRCVAYMIRIVPQDQSTSPSALHESKAVRFVVDDGSGRALVDPTNARLAIGGGTETQAGTLEDMPIRLAMLLEQRGTHPSRRMLFREAVIVDGESIAVLGAGTREPDPDAAPAASYRGEPATRLRLTSSAKHPLVISDDPAALT